MSIASDGEARRGVALNILTMQSPLATTSPLFRHLGSLRLFNLHCGKLGVTADKDHKHVIKRIRNLLLRARLQSWQQSLSSASSLPDVKNNPRSFTVRTC